MRQQWLFGKATDEAIAKFLARIVYWQTKLTGAQRVWIADPAEAQSLETTAAHLLEVAARFLAAQGLLRLDSEWAEATPALLSNAEKFESAARQAAEELEKKHAFERG
jgi:hypothetical protein